MSEEYIEDEVSRAFRKGTIFEASDEDLNRYLKWLASHPVQNDLIRHAQVIKAQTINTIKTDRYIRKASRTNTFHTWVIITLSVFAISFTFSAGWTTAESYNLMKEQGEDSTALTKKLIKLQQEEIQLLKKRLPVVKEK